MARTKSTNGIVQSKKETILAYIESHPTDIKAINEFLVMASKENILREGEFDYGNQSAVEKYYLFPERYNKENDE